MTEAPAEGKTLVVGLGNPLMTDEGVGPLLVERLREKAGEATDCDFLDLGVAGLTVLHAMRGYERVIFIDCAFMDEAPGTLRRFTPDEAHSRKERFRMTLHGQDLMETLELARELGELPERVVLFGIQPQSVEPGQELSPALASSIDDYLETILQELS